MKYKQYIFALAFALLAVPFAMHAEDATTPKTNTELEALITALSARVNTLETELDAANVTITALKAQVGNTTVSDDDDDATGETAQIQTRTQTRANGVAVCHNGKTQYVNVNSALSLKKEKGATIGVCAQERVKTQAKKQVVVADDEEEEDVAADENEEEEVVADEDEEEE